ncbi:hypothetical protein [Portibacter marinus]|uniref:hypothetical protein n=1 Tax=Portibacter marinus TaxID=2898660 RepID=UPI001F16FF10|nr:hypothetical protein [Portibacter marinus]
MNCKNWKNKNLKSILLQEWNDASPGDIKLSLRHFHILHIKKGNVALKIGGKISQYGDNDFVFVRRHEKFKIISAQNAKVICISIKRKYLSVFHSKIHNLPILPVQASESLNYTLLRLSFNLFCSAFKKASDVQVIKDLLEELLIQCYKSTTDLVLDPQSLIKIEAIIKLRKEEPIQLQIVADNFLISPFHLVKGFINHYQSTPLLYQIGYHIQEDFIPEWLSGWIETSEIRNYLESVT